MNEDSSKHKFKFEGVIIDDSKKEADLKALFDSIIQSQLLIKGTTIRRGVTLDVRQKITNNNFNSGNMGNNEEVLQNVRATPNKENVIRNDPQPQSQPQQNEKELKEQLESLKVEYYKYKNKLSSLTEAYNNLRNKADMERPSGDLGKTVKQSTGYFKIFLVSLRPELKSEKQISKNLAIILCVCSVILGFFLSK